MKGLALVAVFALAACSPAASPATPTAVASNTATDLSGRPESRTPAANIDPCDLLTPEEIRAATGSPVERSEGDENSCFWHLWPGGSVLMDLRQEPAEALTAVPGDWQPVRDLGIDAYWEPNSGALVAGDEAVTVYLVYDLPPAPDREKAVELMGKVLDRLD